jgi:hypothetical protein
VHRLIDEMPIKALIVVPLAPLPELDAHEKQLLSRLRVHIGEQQPHVCELLPIVAGHLREQ